MFLGEKNEIRNISSGSLAIFYFLFRFWFSNLFFFLFFRFQIYIFYIYNIYQSAASKDRREKREKEKKERKPKRPMDEEAKKDADEMLQAFDL